MDLLHSIILALVEGITEFLPISSTGHMILVSHVMGIHGPVVAAFEVFIQLGAIMAVAFLYKERFFRLLDLCPSSGDKGSWKDLFSASQGFRGWRGLALLAMTSLPILVVGKLSESFIKGALFNPVTVAWALALGGVVLILVERKQVQQHAIDSMDSIRFRDALFVGCFQCFALWPGMSRAASTILGGIFSGFNRTVAAEYSFLAAVPIMCIVCIKDLVEILPQLSANDLLSYAVGFVVAFVSALITVKGFIHMLQKTTMEAFGYYRIVLALVVFLMLGNQVLH